MPNTINVATANDGAGIVLQKYFTGRNIHATAASRSYANFDLAPGDIVTLDPYSNTTGHEGMAIGSCVALPTASHLHLPAFVVVAIHPDVNRGVDPGSALDLTGAGSGAAVNPRAGGWVDVCQIGTLDVYVDGTTTDITILSPLILTVGTTGSGLVARAVLKQPANTDIGAGVLTSFVQVGGIKGVALEGHTADTVVKKKVSFGPIGFCF